MSQFLTFKNRSRIISSETSGYLAPFSKSFSKAVLSATIAAILVLSTAFVPAAYGNYENLSVTGTAKVKTDASLDVVEQRSFMFDESYSALKWHIPGTDTGSSVDVKLVRSLQANEEGKSTGKWRKFKEVPFNPSWRELVSQTDGTTQAMDDYFESNTSGDAKNFATKPKARTYSFDSTDDFIYIFPKSVQSNMVYECGYTISDAASVYDDVAEIYWTYSLPVGDEEAKDIHWKIQLPVPEDENVVPYENVYAWGHGPEGDIKIRKDGVIEIKVPLVKTGQYSQVHIVFPRKWLHNVDMKSESYKSGTRLGYALSEEDGWTDLDSTHKTNYYFLGLIMCVISLLAVLVAAILYLVYGREKNPINSEESGKLVKPAVRGRLLRWDRHSAYDLAYVIQDLIDTGIIRISTSQDSGAIRLRLTPSAKLKDLDEVEQGAIYLLFEVIGEGYQSISIDDIREFCKKNPDEAFNAMAKWQKTVSDQVKEAKVFDLRSRHASYATYGIAGVIAILGVISIFGGVWPVSCVVALCSSLICAAIAYNMPRRTQFGVSVAEDLENKNFANAESTPEWQELMANAFGDALTA